MELHPERQMRLSETKLGEGLQRGKQQRCKPTFFPRSLWLAKWKMLSI